MPKSSKKITNARAAAMSGLVMLSVLGGCSSDSSSNESAGTGSSTTSAATDTTSTTATTATPLTDDTNWDDLPTTEVTLTGEGLAITDAGTYVLAGSTTGQVTVDTDGAVRVVLDGATIESAVGPAIEVVSADTTVLEIVEGTTNTVSDAATRTDEEIDGAIYSADDLLISGSGTLEVTANFADAIVGKDDLTIESGTINVTSVDDGIRGKDSLIVVGGTIAIDATGDAMKASNDTDLGKGQLVISGGDITITTGDDAIKAEQHLSITGEWTWTR